MNSSRSTDVAGVLSEIAAAASETLELQAVFDRVAASIRRLIPCDHVGVVRILDGDWAVMHATTFDCGESGGKCSDPFPLRDWSPRLRPRPGAIPRVDDAPAELNPDFAADAGILASGVRSALWEPFRLGESWTGGLWLTSPEPNTFTEEHQKALAPIATLLGSAVEHWRIWDAERRRRERLDRLEEPLGALQASLDVREVFESLSAAVQDILPHQFLVLVEIDDAAGTFRVVAHAGKVDIVIPAGEIRFSQQEMERRVLDFEIYRDIETEMPPDTERNRLMIASGMRSWLRVPVRLLGEVHGGIAFGHREPARYTPADAEVARRVADRIALALAHHRLADEARTAAEARERAARLEATVETLTRALEAQGRGRVVGVSHAWKDILTQVSRVASSGTTILITGESGTGKEVVAHLLHEGSPRRDKPFVAINCAALPDQLLESELFGHERGAFTGATTAKIGRIEQAAGGTLFLDEIAEMTPLVQAKLLRVLQEREFQRLGGTKALKADVRVIAATNRDLQAAMERGQFREDLFYRLNVFEIPIPPLRARREDILPLAESFVEEFGRTMGRPAAGISRDAREWILAHPWPGNVRELRNAIERAILLCDGGLITREHLPAVVGRPAAARAAAARQGRSAAGTEPAAALPPGGVDLEAMERAFVEKALKQVRGNKTKAAQLLGLTRAQLYSRLEKYGLS
ncbi:MAG TPA: sigma 54-interacting transcriptional regulator [Verrucomicrobiae bacterium]|nr:sigma 54-interacting transcriptional regulator [Verrucomicrobiae bacterium]